MQTKFTLRVKRTRTTKEYLWLQCLLSFMYFFQVTADTESINLFQLTFKTRTSFIGVKCPIINLTGFGENKTGTFLKEKLILIEY